MGELPVKAFSPPAQTSPVRLPGRASRALCVFIVASCATAGNWAAPASAEAGPISPVEVAVSIVLGTAHTEVRKGLMNAGSSDQWYALTLSIPARALPTRLAVERGGIVLEEADISTVNDAPAPANTSGTWLAAVPVNTSAVATGANPLSIAVRVPPSSSVTLVVAWEEEMRLVRGAYRYRLPLEGLAPSDAFSMRINASMPTELRDTVTSGPLSFHQTEDTPTNYVLYAGNQNVTARQGSVWFNFTPEASGTRGLATYCLGPDGGYFTYAFYPEALGLALEPLPKSIVFAIDFSGSMAGDKEKQAKAAFSGILNQLTADDRFSVLRFDSYVLSLTNGLVPASPANIATAVDRINGQRSSGATNIGEAVQSSLKALSHENDRISAVVLLTDGTPTVGLTNADEILALANVSNTVGAQIHTLALGFEASSQLLERLAAFSGGTYRFIDPDADVVQQISDFYGEISLPLIEDLEIRISEPAYDVSVPDLSVLYNGADITAHGRLRPGGGLVRVEVEGRSSQGSFSVTDSFTPTLGANCSAQERALALSQIDALLDAARAGTASTNDTEQLTDLALLYGFVTPYTPFTLASGDHLITEGPPVPPLREEPLEPEGPVEILVNAPLTGLTLFAITAALAVLAVRAVRRRPPEIEE